VTDAQWSASVALRHRYTEFLAQLLGDDGLLVLPSMPDVAPLISAEESSLEDYRNKALQMLCLSGLSGFPQISLPLASRLGAPLGLSLLGPRGSDSQLVSLARSLF
jgi:amidase